MDLQFKDIRIGNKFIFKYGDTLDVECYEVREVTSICQHEWDPKPFVYSGSTTPHYLNELIPIELNDASLQSNLQEFGLQKGEFSEDYNGYTYFKWHFDIKFVIVYVAFRKSYSLFLIYEESPTMYFVCSGIRYYHQLQNLFYDLTNTELYEEVR